MTKARQEFIRDRIQAGQVKIISPEEIAAAARPQQKTKDTVAPQPQYRPQTQSRPPSAINGYLNKFVKIKLTTGQNIYGHLAEIWQYEIVVHTQVNAVAILKHAVCTIEFPVKEPESNPEQEPAAPTPDETHEPTPDETVES